MKSTSFHFDILIKTYATVTSTRHMKHMCRCQGRRGRWGCERAWRGAAAPSDDAADANEESLPPLVKKDDSTALTGSSSGRGRSSNSHSSQRRSSQNHGRSRSSTGHRSGARSSGGSVDDVISSIYLC